MKRIKRWIRKKFIDYLIRDVFVIIDERDIFRVERGNVYFGNRLLEDEDYNRIRTDAERFRRSFLWNVLSRQLKWEATNAIANKSKTEDDIISGKLILYIVKVIEDTLDNIIK